METPSSAPAAPAPVADSPKAAPVPATPTAPAAAPEVGTYLGNPAADGKPVDPASAEPKTETAYELKVPEGSGLSPAQINEVKAFATANKLTPEIAQAVLNRDATRAGEQAKASAQARIDAVKTWDTENDADPIIGGRASPQMERARQFIAQHAEPALLSVLHNTGLGSHPGFLRFLVKASAGTGESKLADGGRPPAKKKGLAEVMFTHPDSVAALQAEKGQS